MDLNEMMARARELQSRVEVAQDSLDTFLVKGLAGNGACIVEMTAKYNVKKITISDEAMKKSSTELAQIVKDAFIDAKGKADVIVDKVISDATAGTNLPL